MYPSAVSAKLYQLMTGFATTAARALIATRGSVVAIDSATGEVAWEWKPVAEDLDAIAAGQGVVLAVLAGEAGNLIRGEGGGHHDVG